MGHIQSRRVVHLFLAASVIMLLAGCGGGGGGGGSSDATDPVPGTGLVFSGIAATSLTVTWGAAHDNVTSQAALSYRLYYSDSNDITTVDDTLSHGTPAMGWAVGTTTHGVSGLDDSTVYYFSVLVKDEAGNTAIYTPSYAGTLDGTAPTPGTGITYSDKTSYSVTASWGAAADNVTSAGNLLYQLYYSPTNNMTSVDEIITNHHGTTIGTWQSETSSAITSLLGSTTYWFAVIVKDEAGNMTLYTQQSVTTNAATWQTLGTEGLSAGTAPYTSMKVDPDGVPYVAYRDGANSNKLTVRTYTGGSWQTLGTAGFSTGPASYVSLALDGDGIPYVAYSDYDSDLAVYGLTVKKFNGVSWDTLGSERFSAGQPRYISLCIDPLDSIPYVAYQDASKTSKLVVQKYESEAWQPVGSADGISTGGAVFTSLRIDSTGIPYVAYADLATNDVSVIYYSTLWSSVGVPDFTVGNGLQQPLSLCLDADDVPYVAYSDETLGKILLMKFETGSWSPVGSALGLSSGEAEYVSLGFGLNGVSYVAYRDDAQAGKAMLMKYASGSGTWSAVGTGTGFSAAGADYTSLGFDQLGNPVVGYLDENIANKATVRKYY